jgi:ABC-type multidrug transport system fused ATPase/permease subunit
MIKLFKIFKKTFQILEKKFIRNIIFLIFLTLISGVLEILSIGLILPILTVFVENDFYKYSNFFPLILNLSENQIFIIFLLSFLIIYIFKFVFLTFIIHYQNKFSHTLFVDVSSKMLNNYLSKDYLFHVKKSSSTLIRNLTSECNLFSFGVVFPIIKILSEIIIFSFICVALIIYEPFTSIIVILFTVFFSSLILFYTNHKIKKWGDIRHEYSSKILNTMQKSFFSIKEILLYKLKFIFLNEYIVSNKISADAKQKKDTVLQLPRLILELISIFVFITIIYVLILDGKNLSEIFVIIAVFIFASIRLLPSITNILRSVQNLRYNDSVIELINKELNDYWLNEKEINKQNIPKKFDFEEICFDNVFFKYNSNEKSFFLKNLNLKIKKKDKIGVMGKTGSGKTTMINLLTGLLSPDKGHILINKKKDFYIDSWQNALSYVPQNIYITNSSIKFNITFKDTLSAEEEEKLDDVLKKVQLYDFVNSLENKVNTLLGESGNNLSGGQSQRLGIARALYKDSQIIILDEATSALDESTEEKILDTIYSTTNEKTVISISHKKSSLRYCNKIYEVKDGSIN